MSSHHFDTLNAWSQLTEAELRSVFSDEAVAQLSKIRADLQNDPCSLGLTPETFVGAVRQMRTLYESGSRGLASAILEAGEHRDAGRSEAAREILISFAHQCESPFYRAIALRYATKED